MEHPACCSWDVQDRGVGVSSLGTQGDLLLAVSPCVPQPEDFQCLARLSQWFCYTSVFYPLPCSSPVSFSLLSVCLELDLDGE